MGNNLTRLAGTRWGRAARAFVAAAVAFSVLGAGATSSVPRQAHAQPLLLEMSARQPDSTVSVIVQKLARNSGVEARVAALGGKVTRDLSIINAFSAQVPARNVAELAKTQGVRWVSLDAPTVSTGGGTSGGSGGCAACLDTSKLVSSYDAAVRAPNVWNTTPYLQGQGIGVAVVDSGINDSHPDFTDASGGSRVLSSQKFNSNTTYAADFYGHGTHVAGIIAGNGKASGGAYIGIAPKANLINVKVSDDNGGATASDVIAGLQWVLENKGKYNIRVVNMSLNSSVMESYHVDPIDAAAEILWFNGIVVVVASGNTGKNALYPPANDPFVITVGAADDLGTAKLADDKIAAFSASGRTSDGFRKPDLVAPGVKLTAPLASNNSVIARQYPVGLVSGFTGSGYYFKMSGTSMAAPVVAGAVALLLQDEPNLTPDQVKYRLTATARVMSGSTAGAGMLDVPQAVNGNTSASANTGVQASQLLWTGDQPITWNSVNWNSVNWNSVNWNSVNWNSVNWNSVNWNSDFWGQ